MDQTSAFTKLQAANAMSAIDETGDLMRISLARTEDSIKDYQTAELLIGNLLAAIKSELKVLHEGRDRQQRKITEQFAKSGRFLQSLRGGQDG